MLLDTLEWLAVLIGAIVMKLTGWRFIDPALSIAFFVLISAIKNTVIIIKCVHTHSSD